MSELGAGGEGVVVRGHGAEFLDVVPAVFAVVMFAVEVVLVAGVAQELVDDLLDGAGLGALAGVLQDGEEGGEGGAGSGGDGGGLGRGVSRWGGGADRSECGSGFTLPAGGGRCDGGKRRRGHGSVVAVGPVQEQGAGFLADTAAGNVDHAVEGDVVVGVVDEAAEGEEVFDFAAAVEAGAADQAIGDAAAQEGFFDDAGLGIGAVADGDVAGAPVAGGDALFDFAGDVVGFVGFGVGLVDDGAVAFGVVGPEFFVDAFGGFVDDGVGDAADGFGGAVVLFEADGGGGGEVALEVEDVADVGGAPGVDGLVGVADDGEVAAAGGPGAGEAVLDDVGVLEFVHEDVQEALVVALGDVGLGGEEFQGAAEEVVKVDGGVGLQGVLVALVGAGDDLLEVVAAVGADGLGGEAFILGAGDGAEDAAGGVLFGIDGEFLQAAFDDGELVVVVIDDEAAGDLDGFAVAAEDLDAEGVEGAEGHAIEGVVGGSAGGEACAGGAGEEGFDAVAHFAGGFVGEGDGEDAPGGDALFADEVGDALGKDAGFAGAGAGEDEEGAGGGGDGLELGGVEGGVGGGGARIGARFAVGRGGPEGGLGHAGRVALVFVCEVWW